MFFTARKKAKLAEEAQKQEQQRIREEAERKRQEFVEAHRENLATFYKICDMVRSLPKKRHIVVVQRENVFSSDSDRNWAYLQLARRLHKMNKSTNQKWLSDFGENDDALYAFYEPTKLNCDFELALKRFSQDGHRIQRIRYYGHNL